jgi:hypothetical protein
MDDVVAPGASRRSRRREEPRREREGKAEWEGGRRTHPFLLADHVWARGAPHQPDDDVHCAALRGGGGCEETRGRYEWEDQHGDTEGTRAKSERLGRGCAASKSTTSGKVLRIRYGSFCELHCRVVGVLRVSLATSARLIVGCRKGCGSDALARRHGKSWAGTGAWGGRASVGGLGWVFAVPRTCRPSAS